MDNCTKFNDLTAHLRELFKSASYSESTVKDMDFILRAFTNYMNANGMDAYSPEIGEILIHHCKETLKVCDSRVSRAKVIVAKLNRLYQGLDGEEALWTDKTVPVELPDSLSRALDSFISHCRHNGNKETTLHYKQWICSRFLKNLEILGCQSLQSINGELIQSAFLQLGYLRYWERIGPFLRYLFESGQIQRDFSKLIVNRKKYSPQPTVYTQEEVAAIEDSVDCTTAAGVRNYAILLLLSRYGIRSRDLASFADYSESRNLEAAYIFKNSLKKISKKTFRKVKSKPRNSFTREELAVLFSLPDTTEKLGWRDLVLLSVMYSSGARAQEICNLTVKDVMHDEKGNAILTLVGKGEKSRRVKITSDATQLLDKYIATRKISMKPDAHIFPSQRNEHLSVAAIEEIYEKYTQKAKEEHPNLFCRGPYTPHVMRHTTATHLIEAGVPLAIVKNILGHTSIQTTQIYLDISQQTVDRSMEQWNEKWFSKNNPDENTLPQEENGIPDFLK